MNPASETRETFLCVQNKAESLGYQPKNEDWVYGHSGNCFKQWGKSDCKHSPKVWAVLRSVKVDAEQFAIRR